MVGPAKLPQDDHVAAQQRDQRADRRADVVERIHALGSEPKGGTPDDFKALIARDIARWTKVIADAGIERI